MATISEALAIALHHHQGGRLEAAERIYRQILQEDPSSADALHLLGVMACQVGRHEVAVDYIGRAIERKGNAVEFHLNLAKANRALGRMPEAAACFRRALELKPDFAEVHHHLGDLFKEEGKLEEAVASYRRAVELKPGLAEAHNSLGGAFRKQGRLDEAAACYRRALELKPDFAWAQNNLANALKAQGKRDEAAAGYRRALALEPSLAEAHYNLGSALMEEGKLEEAAGCLRRALELKPDWAEVHNNLGNTLVDQGKLDEGIDSLRRAIELKPNFADAHNNLGNACKDAGRLDEAMASYRRAIEARPHDSRARSNLVSVLHYHPAHDDASIQEEHRRWNRALAELLPAFLRSHGNQRDPDRRLRLGYVSPDFRDHAVGRNVLPVLERHDHALFEVFCYAGSARPDALTQRFQEASDAWRNIGSVSDQAVAELIGADRIDILIDLALHTAGQRLAVFARKPAPVQVAWAGYPGTTGLDAVDYRLTDPYLDPPGASGEYSSEEPIRLPDSFWCYDPLTGSPPVQPLPALTAGHITFGSLNNYCKVNEEVIALWSRVLSAVKDSRLLLLSKEGGHRDRALKEFRRHGVEPDRIEWFTRAARPEYLAAYHRIDLGLDTFPYNGHTTSLDSFWMGVPVITLVGRTIVGRGGLSQATNLGLPELIASSPEHYVRIARELAQDLARLSRLRATLRERMQASPLMDTPRFARNVEAAYRQMWQCWCAKMAAA